MSSQIEIYIEIIRHEMFAEALELIDRKGIETIVTRAGGNSQDVQQILKGASVKEISPDQFILK